MITGEGQIDHSTTFNKAPVGVARLARGRSIPVIVIAGGLGEGYRETRELGIDAAFPLVSGPMSLEQAIVDAGGIDLQVLKGEVFALLGHNAVLLVFLG